MAREAVGKSALHKPLQGFSIFILIEITKHDGGHVSIDLGYELLDLL